MDIKALTKENVILKEVLNRLDAAVQVIDRKGITRIYNTAAAEMDNIRPEEVLGRHILEVYPSLNPATSSLLKVMEKNQPIINKQQTVINQRGRAITMLYSTYPLLYRGQIVGACDISRDITKVRELSEKVVDLQAELLDRKILFGGKELSRTREGRGKLYLE
jgi:arginine utilization regulatory protein